MNRFFGMLAAVVISMSSLSAWAVENAVHQANHEMLKALLKTAQQAFNPKDFSLLKAHVTEKQFSVVTVDGNKFDTLPAFENYWNNILKQNKTGLDRVEVNPVADGPTEFLSDTVGICHGTSNDKYFFTNGHTKTMPERWTVVLLKSGGNWKISRIVFSANIMNNPVLTTVKDTAQSYLLWAAAAGLLLGALSMWAVVGRKKTA